MPGRTHGNMKPQLYGMQLRLDGATIPVACHYEKCLADAYLTNSNSRFLPRIEEHKLRFQLEAFRFYQEPGNQMAVS
ncbi:hypothetical protein PFLUV_G00136470 [Perca fluviatilis]|uniref:Uncharacterized protein n=1 Tax=Perca fluviatilis TaxID=8168 RepID=A0A6A5F5H8_PERFL|nr:hypothetical protein PFLUV_G00136470 [Perca fluviatilis]